MIELLLQAERALSMGLIDDAERVYRQASEADPRNSIAVVGLARVALERGADEEAWRQARRALAIDPENAAARRIVDRLEETWRHRGTAPPDEGPDSADEAELLANAAPAPADRAPATPPASAPPSPATPTTVVPAPTPAPRRGLVARLFGRNRS